VLRVCIVLGLADNPPLRKEAFALNNCIRLALVHIIELQVLHRRLEMPRMSSKVEFAEEVSQLCMPH
jgi:hypothetical protein